MKRVYKLCFSLMLTIGLSYYSVAQTSLGTSANLLGELKKDLSSKSTNRSVGSSVDLDVPGSSFTGKVNYKESATGSELLMGEIDGVGGSSFFIKANSNSLEGHIILKGTKKAYKYYSDASGNAFVKEEDINKLICIDYENKPSKNQKSEKQAREAASISPALLDLQSLPGAAGVVMLDFDGYYMPAGNYWNNGNAIDAAPSGMSDDAVLEHWEVVSEDYRPFNVNITTNEAVFNSYPRNRRMRVVVTPTNTAAPGAGGVAYFGSFNWDNDVPCWVFITSGKSGGDASSHEVGHCFDLQHDARSNPVEGYFLGIDKSAWAPIMGAGYYRPVVQWSKGEYNYAKNDGDVLQDDIATIAGSKFGIGFRGDDYGNGTASAADLSYGTNGAINQKSGIIANEGDIDFFSFKTGGGNITINANTVSRDGNLDIIIRLYNSAGQEIANANPTTPGFIEDANGRDAKFYAALNASLTANVTAGTYYVSIDGTGANDKGYGGYSAYGSIGTYFISGTIPPATTVANSDGFAIFAKDCAYGGYNIGLNEGNYTRADLINKGINDDDISSMKVKEGFKVILYKDDNYTGTALEVTGNKDCLVADGFNDVVTSLRVVANGVTNLNGTYFLQNRHSSLVLDVPGSSADNIQLQQYTLNSSAAQQFTLTHLDNGAYKITNVSSGKALDVDGIKTDDGVKVQQWSYAGSANQQWILVASDGGFYKLIARHSAKVLEIGGWSTVNGGLAQQWTNGNQASGQWKIVPVQAVVGTGDGLIGSYYNGMNFETARLNRKDATINFAWGNGAPDANVNADGFSVRWTGQIQPKYSGVYTFHANSDNGRRLWINGQLIIDKWLDDWSTEYTGTITLTAGQKYDFKMEYFENYGGAGAKLEWSSALQAREVIPTSQLYSPAVTNVDPQTPTNLAPTVSVTSPSNGASFNAAATINITANAADADGSVAKVEFYNGATKIGEDASAPYAYTWSNVAAGTYTITTKATDDKGAVASTSVTVTVVIVAVDQCSGVAQYVENGGYIAASKAKNAGRKYECKEFPYSGWCNGAAWAYAPGTGAYWTDAWYDRGTCTATTGGANSNTSESLSISPNPVQGELNISSSYSLSGASLMIIDVTGKTVYNSGASESISTADLDAGIYTLILITSDNQKMTKRFVKMK
ncbi:MAG: RICIN domain-containing protein [Cytophagaceae bacterium]|nr:RICIN domain-containing protein [Cytophagaceae bacterium]